jgi:hypothetical protein
MFHVYDLRSIYGTYPLHLPCSNGSFITINPKAKQQVARTLSNLLLYTLKNINPLTPELNPSAQRCLTRFFTGDYAS